MHERETKGLNTTQLAKSKLRMVPPNPHGLHLLGPSLLATLSHLTQHPAPPFSTLPRPAGGAAHEPAPAAGDALRQGGLQGDHLPGQDLHRAQGAAGSWEEGGGEEAGWAACAVWKCVWTSGKVCARSVPTPDHLPLLLSLLTLPIPCPAALLLPACRATSWPPPPPSRTACPTSSTTPTPTSPTALRRCVAGAPLCRAWQAASPPLSPVCWGSFAASLATTVHHPLHALHPPSPHRLQPREEDKPVPFSYIGFGGGRHGCMVSSGHCWASTGALRCSWHRWLAFCTGTHIEATPSLLHSRRLLRTAANLPPLLAALPFPPRRARTLRTCRSRRSGACCCATLTLSCWTRCPNPTTPPWCAAGCVLHLLEGCWWFTCFRMARQPLATHHGTHHGRPLPLPGCGCGYDPSILWPPALPPLPVTHSWPLAPCHRSSCPSPAACASRARSCRCEGRSPAPQGLVAGV